jgi:hypothetical protein
MRRPPQQFASAVRLTVSFVSFVSLPIHPVRLILIPDGSHDIAYQVQEQLK